MAYRIEVLPSAAKELRKLPVKFRRQVARRIDALGDNPRPDGVRALKARGKGLWRIRSGDYRVIYRIKDEVLVVLVLKVADRKDAY